MTTLSEPRRRRPDKKPQNAEAQDSRAPDGSRTGDPVSDLMPPSSVRQEESVPGSATVRKKRTPYYPTGDGKPMVEDVLHLALMNYIIPALMHYFRPRPDVLVTGNDFLYYEEGNPKARVSPDCYVVPGRSSPKVSVTSTRYGKRTALLPPL